MAQVKILISTYNGEKYLEEQLDSILNQDYPDIQILVRDDGSKDKTKEILKNYKTKYNIEYYQGTNIGCAKSFWELLFNSGDSDYYAFADQDDVWDTDKISRAIHRLKREDSEIPLLYCSSLRVTDAQLNIIEDNGKETETIETFKHSLIHSIASGCTFVMNKSACDILKRYDSQINFLNIHDWTAHRIIAAFGKVIKDNHTTMKYRQHGNNLIGAEKATVAQFFWKCRNYKKSDRTRYQFVKSFYSAFFNELSVENQNILKCFLDYPISKKKKKDFYNMFKGELRFVDRCIFKVLVGAEKI